MATRCEDQHLKTDYKHTTNQDYLLPLQTWKCKWIMLTSSSSESRGLEAESSWSLQQTQSRAPVLNKRSTHTESAHAIYKGEFLILHKIHVSSNEYIYFFYDLSPSVEVQGLLKLQTEILWYNNLQNLSCHDKQGELENHKWKAGLHPNTKCYIGAACELLS